MVNSSVNVGHPQIQSIIGLKMNTYLAIASLALLSALVAVAAEPLCKAATIEEKDEWVSSTKLEFDVEGEGYQKGWTMEVTYDTELDGEFIVAFWGSNEACRSAACPAGINKPSCSVCTFQAHSNPKYSPFVTINKGAHVEVTIDIEYWSPQDEQIVSAIIDNDGIDYCK